MYNIESVLIAQGEELPNFDKNTNIFYGVISQHDIMPEVLSDIYINAIDLDYEDGLKELNTNLEAIKDLRALFNLSLEIFGVINYPNKYRNSKTYEWMKDKIETQQIKVILRSFKDEDYITIKDILEEVFNQNYEADNPNILYKEDGYEIINCLDSDLMITKSLYYCFAPACSPCVPCAGNLSDIREDREYTKKTYCLDPSFFDDEDKPKYKIYEVATDKEID